MADSKISLRYATSFLDLAVGKNMLDGISSDIERIIHIFEKSPDLKRAMKSPVIKPETKLIVLDEIFKPLIDKETLHFMRFLIKKGRENLIGEIAAKFLELRDEKLGLVNVDILTAYELTEEQKISLKNNIEKMLNKKTRFRIKINPEVLGGFIAKVNDTVYDASVKHQLEILRQQLLKSGAALN